MKYSVDELSKLSIKDFSQLLNELSKLSIKDFSQLLNELIFEMQPHRVAKKEFYKCKSLIKNINITLKENGKHR